MDNKETIVTEVVNRQKLSQQHRDTIIDFMGQMLEVSPMRRMSAVTALGHDIFRMNNQEEIRLRKNRP